MRYALVDGVRAEPVPGLRGTCKHCESEMIAKCGRVKVWHWAHKSRSHCDHWWESETPWHRAWKDHFPPEWQEVSHVDLATGETHIADVKNPFGLVIEFQHSVIKPEERRSREAFYGEMVWVVDGLRNELDGSYFSMGLGEPIQKNPLAYPVKWWSRSRLLHNWSEASAKVYLDFGQDHLWRLLLFDAERRLGVVGPIAKSAFIDDCSMGTSMRVSYLDADDADESVATGESGPDSP